MRKITTLQISTFLGLLAIIVISAIYTAYLTVGGLVLGDFRAISIVFFSVVLIYLYAILVYRVFLMLFPLMEGELIEGSREEFVAQINILFYLVLFNSIIRTHILPVPLMRLVYLALGAKLGRNTYSAGVLLDPPLIFIGNNSIIGHDAVLFAHAIEGASFSLASIHIGDSVTVGAHAVVMSDVWIGDGAIISAGAVVTKGSRIGANEIWGGVPARPIKSSTQTRPVT